VIIDEPTSAHAPTAKFGIPTAKPGLLVTVTAALRDIAAAAEVRDRRPVPAFPHDAFALLRAAGLLAWNAVDGPVRPPAAEELDLVRRVAAADGSVGRIFDGHLNGVERLAVQAPADLRDRELEEIRAGRLLVGVWGGEPRPDEGSPATVERVGGVEVLTGVKTFCSGAGGLDRALVLARDPDAAAPVAVWIDLTEPATVEIDPCWYRSSGLRASVSHRVVFHRARIVARFGDPGSLSLQPWFGRDALRTAASWAGMADQAADSALAELAGRPARGDLEAVAAGRILTCRETITTWLQRAARAMDVASADIAYADLTTTDLASVSLHARAAISGAVRELLDEAARACGSHPFATGGSLDRARRDLEVFTLQHRLDPALARAGANALSERAQTHTQTHTQTHPRERERERADDRA
jgi:alkylation response protein AidB-like acyl-CoA dehydrogenase